MHSNYPIKRKKIIKIIFHTVFFGNFKYFSEFCIMIFCLKHDARCRN